MGIVLVTVFGYGWLFMKMFSTVGCEGICHDEIIWATWAAVPWLLFGTAGSAVVTGLILAGIGRRSAWVAVTGLVLVLAVVVGSSLLLEAGFQPMHERNAQAAQGLLPPPPLPDPTGSWSLDGGEAPPRLHLDADGTLAAHDGCNAFLGAWEQDPDGTIRLELTPLADQACDGVDIWLSHATSAVVIDGHLMINGVEGTPIGMLETDR